MKTDPFVDAVKRGADKLDQGHALPRWAFVTAAASMRASNAWAHPDMVTDHTLPPVSMFPTVSGEIEGR